jgi:hypothetical protein
LLLGDAQRDRRLGIAGREDQVFGDAAAQSVDWLGRSVHPRCDRLAAGRRASMVDVDNPAWNGRWQSPALSRTVSRDRLTGAYPTTARLQFFE